MKVSEQTLQQIERFLKKIAQKFPTSDEASLVTDIHIVLFQESGELIAFDDDDNGSYTPAPTNNRNKYAWRMNCEDGSDYGIYPENYETRQEYNEAIVSAKSNEQGSVESIKINLEQEHSDSSTEIKYTFCKISRIDNGKNDYYFPGELCLRVGDFVKVPTEVGESNAIVIHIQAYSESEAPKPINETEKIIEKMF